MFSKTEVNYYRKEKQADATLYPLGDRVWKEIKKMEQ